MEDDRCEPHGSQDAEQPTSKRAAKLIEMTDAELQYAHTALHNPNVVADEWVALLEQEMARRGLLKAQ